MTQDEALQNKTWVQKVGVDNWFANDCVGSLVWATGVGKSKAAIDCIIELLRLYPDYKGLLVTPTEEMRDNDWPLEFFKWGLNATELKLICYASLGKENLDNYDYIIYDEVHKLTTANMVKLKKKLHFGGIKVLGLTATFPTSNYDENEDRVKLLTSLIPPIHTIKTDEAVDMRLIADFEVRVLKFKLDNTVRNIPAGKKSKVMYTEEEYYSKLTKRMQYAVMNDLKGLKFVTISKRSQLLYNLPSKLKLAKLVMGKLCKTKRTLVFAGSIEQANALCGTHVYHSKTNDDYLVKFQNGTINTLGAVKALNEGKNFNNLEQAFIVQIDGVDRNLVQRIGRCVRVRYDDMNFKALIVILVAQGTADEKWYKTSIKSFETKRIKEYLVSPN